MKNVLFINIYPSSITKYLLSGYILKAVVLNDANLCCDIAIDVIDLPSKITLEEELLLKEKAELYDVFCYSIYTWNIDVINRLNLVIGKNKICIFGGPEIDGMKLNHAVNSSNYYIIGQGENKFRTLLEYLIKKTSTKKENMIWNQDDNRPINTLSIYKNRTIPESIYKRKVAYLESQRGCKFQCSYCNYSKNINKVLYFDIDVILSELDYILNIGVREIRFIDSVFTSNVARANTIIDRLLYWKNKGKTLPQLFIETEWHTITADFIEKIAMLKTNANIKNNQTMKNLNMPQIYTSLCKNYNVLLSVGIQSFNPTSLESVNRAKVETKRFVKFMESVIENNIICKFDMMLGLPYESVGSYYQGIDLICKYLLHTDCILNIHILKILPNTLLYSEYNKWDIKIDENKNVISTNSLTEYEMKKCTLFSGVLFRIINSSLRQSLLQACIASNYTVSKVILQIIDGISDDLMQYIVKEFENQDSDEYWNTKLFHDLPHEYLANMLRKMK